MKKLIEFVLNPQKLLAICGVCFGVALVDSLINSASSITDLSIVGKIFTGLLMIGFSILVIRYLLLPIYYWLISLVQ